MLISMKVFLRTRLPSLLAVAFVAALMSACGSSKKVAAAAPAAAAATTAFTSNPSSGGAVSPASADSQIAVTTVQAGSAGNAAAAPSPVGMRSAALAADPARVVYFDYDSFLLRSDARPAIEAHARWLMADRSRRLVIEGHADERGSHEYNLALGQKRADAVARTLTLLGVTAEQLEVVSFGEERPATRASNEDAWSKNRRAEFKERR